MSENETKGRFRREFESYYADKQVIPSESDWILADAIDRIAADVAAVKAKVDSVAPEDVRHFVESEKAWVALVEEQRDAATRERDEARAEAERLKAKVDSIAPEDARPLLESAKAWVNFVEEKRDCAIRERDEARAEVRRLLGELAEARAETQRIQDEADDREQTEKVKRLNAEIEKTHRTLLNRTWERDIAKAEVERLRQAWVLTNVLDRAWKEVPRE